MAILNPHPPCPILSFRSPRNNSYARISCSIQSKSIVARGANSKKEYKPGVFDDIFLNVFRSKMAQEIGWDSEKPGYDGLIDVAHRIMTGRSNSEATEAAVRILISLFPPSLLELYKLLISPMAGGKVAALMVARVTAISCQWLMGPCAVNSVDLPDKSSWSSGVFVEKCRYLEESKCVGVCINTCKLPTQIFFKEHMGVPLVMEPNFDDYSCQSELVGQINDVTYFPPQPDLRFQLFLDSRNRHLTHEKITLLLDFNFGVVPPPPEDDSTLKQPCLQVCPTANRRLEIGSAKDELKCPKS